MKYTRCVFVGCLWAKHVGRKKRCAPQRDDGGSWSVRCCSQHCVRCALAVEAENSTNDLIALLAHPVLCEKQTLAEVQKFCDRRIAVMPKATTWSAWQHEAERIEQAYWKTSSFAACRRRGAMRRAALSGWIRFPADRLSHPQAALRSSPRPVDSRAAL